MDLSREKPTKKLIDARTPQGEWEHEGEVAQVRKTAKYKKWRAQVDAIENKTGKRRRLNATERKTYDPPGPIEKHYKVWVNAEEKQDLLLGSGRKKPLPLLGLPAYPPISSSGSGPSVGPGTSRTSSSNINGGALASRQGSASPASRAGTAAQRSSISSGAGRAPGATGTQGRTSDGKDTQAGSGGAGRTGLGGNTSRDSTRSANSLGPDAYGGNPSRDTRASANSLGPDTYGGRQGGGGGQPSSPSMASRGGDLRQPLGALANALRGPSPSILGSYAGPKGSPLLGLNPAARQANVNWSGEEPDNDAFDPLTGVNPAISRNPFDVLTDIGRVQKVNGNITGEFGPQASMVGTGRFGLPMDLEAPGLQNAAFSPPDKQATQYQPRDPLNTIPGSEASIRNITDLTGAPRLAEAARQRQASLGTVLADRYGLSDPAAIDMVGKMARTTAGETMGLSPAEQAAAAHTMFNRLDLNRAFPQDDATQNWGPDSFLEAYDANGLRQGTTMNSAFKGAIPGTQSYADALNAVAQAASPQGAYLAAPPKVQDASHYLQEESTRALRGGTLPGWAKDGTRFGAHTFYSPDTTPQQLAEARGIAPPADDPATGIATAFSGMAPKPRPKPDRPLLSAPPTMVAGRPDVPVSTNYMATRAPTPFTPTSLMGDYVEPTPQMAKQDKGAMPEASGYRPWEGSYVRPEFSAFGGMPAAPAPEVADNYRPWEGSYTRPEFSGLGGFPAAAAAPPAPPGNYRPWEGSYVRPEFSGLGGFPAAAAPSIASLIGTPPTPQRAPYKRGEPIDYPGTVVEKNQSVEDPFRGLNIAQNPFDTEYADFTPSLEARRAMATNQKLAEARAIQDMQNPDVGDQWSDLREFEQDAKRELYGPSGVPTLTGPSMLDVSRAKAGPGAYDDPENRTTINQTQPKNIAPATSPAAVNALRERLQDLAAQGVPVFNEYRYDLPGGRLPQTAATQPRSIVPRGHTEPPTIQHRDLTTKELEKLEKAGRYNTDRIKSNIQRSRMVDRSGGRGELKAEQVAALVNRIRQRLQERPTIAQPPATPPASEPPIYPTSISFPQYTQQWAFQGGPFG